MKNRIKKLIKKTIPNSLIVRHVTSSPRTILLTFDDGPHEEITPEVLSILDKYNARTIFFVVGKFVKNNALLLKEIKKRKHIIGNHSYEHFNRKMVSYNEYKKELQKCQAIIKRITGDKPSYYRPPMGLITLNGLILAKKYGMKTVLWSCDGGEWSNNIDKGADVIANQVLNLARDRSIVCLHDNNPKIIDVLEIILPALKLEGYDLANGINGLPK